MPDWAEAATVIGGTILFMRRDDGIDWYDYIRAEARFQEGAVLALTIAGADAGSEMVGAIYRDPTKLIPFSQRVIEIDGVPASEDKPHNLFEWLTYHPDSLSFSGVAGPPQAPEPDLTVKDYQFAGQAAAEGIITDDAAMAWVATGKTPDRLIEAVKQAVPDPDRQKRVLLFLAGTTTFPLSHELTPILAASFGKNTPELVKAFFLAASQR
jgi:hypothetical protein